MSSARRQPRKVGWLTHILLCILMLAIGATTTLAAVHLSAGHWGNNVAVPAAPDVPNPHYAKWEQPVRGITLSGFQNFIVNDSTTSMLERQERAARNHWKANTVRLQILQDRLVGPKGDKWNAHYFYYIRNQIRHILAMGMTVVINDQTEVSMGFADNEPAPDYATKVFWGRIMNYWMNMPNVIFDLFNEPRNETWDQWLNGGYIPGFPGKYIGEQELVNFIRNEGAHNEIWVEGINWASTLAGVPILKGENIVYTFHHPGAPHPSKDIIPGKKIWWDSFGYLAAQGYKVIDAEFANYVGNYYWDNHPGKSVREYLTYLQMHHIGLVCWSLVAGSLNANGNYESESKEPQGDGKIVAAFFHRQSRAERISVLAKR